MVVDSEVQQRVTHGRLIAIITSQSRGRGRTETRMVTLVFLRQSVRTLAVRIRGFLRSGFRRYSATPLISGPTAPTTFVSGTTEFAPRNAMQTPPSMPRFFSIYAHEHQGEVAGAAGADFVPFWRYLGGINNA